MKNFNEYLEIVQESKITKSQSKKDSRVMGYIEKGYQSKDNEYSYKIYTDSQKNPDVKRGSLLEIENEVEMNKDITSLIVYDITGNKLSSYTSIEDLPNFKSMSDPRKDGYVQVSFDPRKVPSEVKISYK